MADGAFVRHNQRVIRSCAWHKKNFGAPLTMGEIAPFNKREVTHGMCEACSELEIKRQETGGDPLSSFETENTNGASRSASRTRRPDAPG